MPSDQPDDFDARLADIERLLGSDPAEADRRAAELLSSVPDQPMALLFQGIARRLSGRPQDAVGALTKVCELAPDAPLPQLQLGLALRETGNNTDAVAAMRRAVAARPDFSDAWLALADMLGHVGDATAANDAYLAYVEHSAGGPVFIQASAALGANRIAEAESLLRAHLDRHPTDVRALCLLGEVAVRQARPDVAQDLLARCLDLAPGYDEARYRYAAVLMRVKRMTDALSEVNRLLDQQRDNVNWLKLKSTILLHLLEYDDAAAVYHELVRLEPNQPRFWANLGHALRFAGQQQDAITAYRKAISLQPDFGEAYWNLANIKTYALTDDDAGQMQYQLASSRLSSSDRVHFHFALGKALEDRERFAEAFSHYEQGNRLMRQGIRYRPDAVTEHVQFSKALLTHTFFAERAGIGSSSDAPIFIVGLPRSGSTLVEQILASHSAVEATMELPNIMDAAASLAQRAGNRARYPDLLADMGAEEFDALAAAYLDATEALRKQKTLHFIDKMPNNFLHLGLVQLMFPRARIIDVRRHPMACGWSVFRQLFAREQHFSYDLADIGHYYRDYAALMQHFDEALPGRIYRVQYEALVNDTEQEIRRLLEYCRLPFEDACLHFYRQQRAVSTPSSEQVRLPVFRHGLQQWRHFEPWLEPLAAALDGPGASVPAAAGSAPEKSP
ncbi:MAG: sulfotransferase [Woeseia sp.]